MVTFDYGMKKGDPIKKVLFYKKNDPHKAYKFSKVLILYTDLRIVF